MNGIPDSLVHEFLQRLDLESLCSTACVSRTLNLCVSQLLSTRSCIDLSGFSPDHETLKHILYRFDYVKTVTVDCLRLGNSAVVGILGASLQELTLMKGAFLSYTIMYSIGRRCPDLRILSLEFVGDPAPKSFKKALNMMLERLIHLEFLSIKLRGAEVDACDLMSSQLFLPSTLKAIKLQPVSERDTIQLLQRGFGEDGLFLKMVPNSSMPSLQQVSLVLDVMSDNLIICIANAFPLLVDLNLEDKPHKEPLLPHDLTNNGLQSLRLLQHLKTLSIIRSRLYYPASFKRINDMGMLLLSENCKGLESVSLGGFSTVTDAGFAAILNSCRSLRRFEAQNVPTLSDLTFHNMSNVVDSFIALRLLSCSLVTSEVIEQLTSCASLEALDVSGCRSVADSCIFFLSFFSKLSTLNLGGADVTDSGLAVLGNGCYPLARLCLRGCKRVTDKGISLLLQGGGTVSKTLTSLDIGHMPGISDDAICAIASYAPELTELCIRFCFFVTDASVRVLASKRAFIRSLDLFRCSRMSIELVKFFQKPSFCKLKWLGVGLTSCATQRDAFGVVLGERPWLTICFDGCESGCHDGWHFYHSDAP